MYEYDPKDFIAFQIWAVPSECSNFTQSDGHSSAGQGRLRYILLLFKLGLLNDFNKGSHT